MQLHLPGGKLLIYLAISLSITVYILYCQECDHFDLYLRQFLARDFTICPWSIFNLETNFLVSILNLVYLKIPKKPTPTCGRNKCWFGSFDPLLGWDPLKGQKVAYPHVWAQQMLAWLLWPTAGLCLLKGAERSLPPRKGSTNDGLTSLTHCWAVSP